MRHPTDGVLRRLVDEPAGVPDADREHVADCRVCRTELTSAREDSAVIGAALDLDVAAALGLSPGSVGTTVRRAESALRKELNRHASSD